MVASTLSPYSPRSAWQPWSRAVRRPTARCQWHSHRVDWQALAPSTPPGARYAVRASRFVFLGRGAPVNPLLIALIQNRGADRRDRSPGGLAGRRPYYPPGPTMEARGTVVMVPAGQLPNPGTPTGTTVKRLCPSPTTTPIAIDSVALIVTQASCRGMWKTTAWSTAPAMFVQGEAHSSERAQLLNAIMVTIRFASEP